MSSSSTPDRRIGVGRRGEQLASEYLERQGYVVIERNYRTRAGELDLVLVDNATLVFCEVKTLIARSGATALGSPLESIRRNKRLQVRRMARAWLSDRPAGASGFSEIRFDAVGVTLTLAGEPTRVEHLANAF